MMVKDDCSALLTLIWFVILISESASPACTNNCKGSNKNAKCFKLNPDVLPSVATIALFCTVGKLHKLILGKANANPIQFPKDSLVEELRKYKLTRTGIIIEIFVATVDTVIPACCTERLITTKVKTKSVPIRKASGHHSAGVTNAKTSEGLKISPTSVQTT